jgi:hypothetical protein
MKKTKTIKTKLSQLKMNDKFLPFEDSEMICKFSYQNNDGHFLIYNKRTEYIVYEDEIVYKIIKE